MSTFVSTAPNGVRPVAVVDALLSPLGNPYKGQEARDEKREADVTRSVDLLLELFRRLHALRTPVAPREILWLHAAPISPTG